jgi:prepilin-type N-terminal cleavage/methylation domain-containing protein
LKKKQSFTLIELIAVTAVLSILISITIPRLRFEPTTYQLKKLEREITTIFRMAQFLALTYDRNIYIFFDNEKKTASIIDPSPQITNHEIEWKTLYTIYMDKNILINTPSTQPIIKVDKHSFIDDLSFEISIEDKKYSLRIENNGYTISPIE